GRVAWRPEPGQGQGEAGHEGRRRRAPEVLGPARPDRHPADGGRQADSGATRQGGQAPRGDPQTGGGVRQEARGRPDRRPAEEVDRPGGRRVQSGPEGLEREGEGEVTGPCATPTASGCWAPTALRESASAGSLLARPATA